MIPKEEIDFLTNIPNEKFVLSHYSLYVLNHNNAKFIMIDFQKFKLINDNYSHEMGDLCLKCFANILTEVFSDSIVARLHGDEYCIVTNQSDDEIENSFKLINDKILVCDATKLMGNAFEFNAGVVKASTDIVSTREKADYIMYCAKNDEKNYYFYSDDLWNKKLKEDALIKKIKEGIKSKALTYYRQSYFKFDDDNYNPTDLIEIDSKAPDGSTIISFKNYEFLRQRSLIREIDLYNLNAMLDKFIYSTNLRMLLNFDCKSLLSRPQIIEHLNKILNESAINPSKIILSINVDGLEQKFYKEAVKLILELKKLGLKICIDRVDANTPDMYFININPHYLKFDTYSVNAIYRNKLARELFMMKFGLLVSNCNTSLLFTNIKSNDDLEHIKYLTKDMKKSNIFISGDYIEKEEKFL